MHENKSFLEVIGEKFGNPRARWANGSLIRGQRVKFILKDEQRMVDGITSGKRKNGNPIIRYRGGGRTWMLPIPSRNILVEW
jgi:hypothetical protein